MTSPPPYVPDEMIPDEEQRIGSESTPAVTPLPEFDPPTCPLCDGHLLGSDPVLECMDCGHEQPTEAEQQRRRRLSRLREIHNDQSFIQVSVEEWHERHGDRL